MKLVVGLGNPGKDYEGTRHNIGFEVLHQLASRFKAGKFRSKFNGQVGEIEIGGQKVVLLFPSTYMNLSGQAVRAAADFYKLSIADLILVCDDLSLEPGRIRIRSNGSAGGQKGLANTIQQLGSDAFPRLRIGIGGAPGERSAADYVLGVFAKPERAVMDVAVMRAADAIEAWVGLGIELAMNRFNPDPSALPTQKKKRLPSDTDSEPSKKPEKTENN